MEYQVRAKVAQATTLTATCRSMTQCLQDSCSVREERHLDNAHPRHNVPYKSWAAVPMLRSQNFAASPDRSCKCSAQDVNLNSRRHERGALGSILALRCLKGGTRGTNFDRLLSSAKAIINSPFWLILWQPAQRRIQTPLGNVVASRSVKNPANVSNAKMAAAKT